MTNEDYAEHKTQRLLAMYALRSLHSMGHNLRWAKFYLNDGHFDNDPTLQDALIACEKRGELQHMFAMIWWGQ